jgi:hypothetical protein
MTSPEALPQDPTEALSVRDTLGWKVLRAGRAIFGACG